VIVLASALRWFELDSEKHTEKMEGEKYRRLYDRLTHKYFDFVAMPGASHLCAHTYHDHYHTNITLQDDPTFMDSRGYPCTDWRYYDCTTWKLNEPNGYTSSALHDIQTHCPAACMLHSEADVLAHPGHSSLYDGELDADKADQSYYDSIEHPDGSSACKTCFPEHLGVENYDNTIPRADHTLAVEYWDYKAAGGGKGGNKAGGIRSECESGVCAVICPLLRPTIAQVEACQIVHPGFDHITYNMSCLVNSAACPNCDTLKGPDGDGGVKVHVYSRNLQYWGELVWAADVYVMMADKASQYEPKPYYNWDWSGSFYFATTILSTIVSTILSTIVRRTRLVVLQWYISTHRSLAFTHATKNATHLLFRKLWQGYGNFTPVTNQSKLLLSLVSIPGIGLYGYCISQVASCIVLCVSGIKSSSSLSGIKNWWVSFFAGAGESVQDPQSIRNRLGGLKTGVMESRKEEGKEHPIRRYVSCAFL
jgi:hypothetical protein